MAECSLCQPQAAEVNDVYEFPWLKDLNMCDDLSDEDRISIKSASKSKTLLQKSKSTCNSKTLPSNVVSTGESNVENQIPRVLETNPDITSSATGDVADRCNLDTGDSKQRTSPQSEGKFTRGVDKIVAPRTGSSSSAATATGDGMIEETIEQGSRSSMKSMSRRVQNELLRNAKNRQNMVGVSEVNLPSESLRLERHPPNSSIRHPFRRRTQSVNNMDFRLFPNNSRMEPHFLLDAIHLPLEDLHVANNAEIPEDIFLWGEQRPAFPSYPQGERKFTECLICYDWKELHLRVCCKFSACDDCHTQYFTTQVMQGITKIQCLDPQCKRYVHRDEILARLSGETKEKFYKFLVDANKNPNVKTCPRCSHITSLPSTDTNKAQSTSYGVKAVCSECDLVWCFPCHAPWHEGVTCKEYVRGDKLLRNWAKEFHYGQQNAQKCPKCKVYIQRTTGCDHMVCSRCDTNFCYRCGERYRILRFVGDHYSRLSILGCKYRFKPDKPAQRKFIRGSIFGGKLAVAPVVGGLAIGVGAVLLAVGVVVLPFYGSYKLHKKLQQKKRFKRQRKLREDMRKRLETLRSRDEGRDIISCPISFSKKYHEDLDIARMNIFDEIGPDNTNRSDCLGYDPHLSMTLRLNVEDDKSSASSDSEDDCSVTVTEVKVITERVKEKDSDGMMMQNHSDKTVRTSRRSASHRHSRHRHSLDINSSENDSTSLDRIVQDMVKMADELDVTLNCSLEGEEEKCGSAEDVVTKSSENLGHEHVNEEDESTAL